MLLTRVLLTVWFPSAQKWYRRRLSREPLMIATCLHIDIDKSILRELCLRDEAKLTPRINKARIQILSWQRGKKDD